MSWQLIDLIIIAIIGLSVLTGLFRGFVKELIALCVWVVAIWLAFTYSQEVSSWLQPYIQDLTARTVVAFVAILLVTIIIGSIFNAMLSFVLRRSGLSGTDRLLGMGFGFVRGVFIVTLLLLVFDIAAIPYQPYTKDSRLVGKFVPLVNWLSGFMPDFIKHMKVLEKTHSPTDKIKKESSPMLLNTKSHIPPL